LSEVPCRERARVTGVPVRREVLHQRRIYLPKGYLLLLGGSLGSSLLTEALLAAAPFLAGLPDFALYIATGRFGDPEELERRFRAAGIEKVRVVRWIEDMGRVYAGAKLIVSRAGASTVAEVLAAGRPAVFVPWSGAAGKHQDRNAHSVSARRGAVVLSEGEVRQGKLGQLIASLWEDAERLSDLARGAAALAQPQAAWEVARELLWVAEGLLWTVPACT